MKKFKFSLDTVLAYKQQVLDALQGEHAVLLAQVRAQEEMLEAVEQQYRDYNREFRERSEQGISILDATLYQNGLRVLERDIQRETEKLRQLREREEAKREEVVEAKKDTSSLEKLKDKKLDQYNKAVAKNEEQLIDEFISSTRVSATSA